MHERAVEHLTQTIKHLSTIIGRRPEVRTPEEAEELVSSLEIAAITHAKEAYRCLTGHKWEETQNV